DGIQQHADEESPAGNHEEAIPQESTVIALGPGAQQELKVERDGAHRGARPPGKGRSAAHLRVSAIVLDHCLPCPRSMRELFPAFFLAAVSGEPVSYDLTRARSTPFVAANGVRISCAAEQLGIGADRNQ